MLFRSLPFKIAFFDVLVTHQKGSYGQSIPHHKKLAKTVITPAIEYQSTNGEDAAGPNARVTIGAIRKGKILTNTELKP